MPPPAAGPAEQGHRVRGVRECHEGQALGQRFGWCACGPVHDTAVVAGNSCLWKVWWEVHACRLPGYTPPTGLGCLRELECPAACCPCCASLCSHPFNGMPRRVRTSMGCWPAASSQLPAVHAAPPFVATPSQMPRPSARVKTAHTDCLERWAPLSVRQLASFFCRYPFVAAEAKYAYRMVDYGSRPLQVGRFNASHAWHFVTAAGDALVVGLV